MPNPLPNSQAPQNLDDFDHGTLAILSMGNGYARPAPRSTGESKVGNFGRRLFHKVDRIQAAGQNDREGAHPQANRIVERANKSFMKGIKTRLGRERKGWMDELPNVMCAHRTSLKTSNGETPYSLMFKSEVGEFVYQKNEASRVENLGKLGPKREGPYLVVEVYQNGSYKLCTMDDREVSRVCEQSSQSP
ncbi:reverse transcriptase domain-containing protein [Tanacetum coccineum]|uniref:Reverse transcriptase domain-containing protein n=1 Tax=Tanacetum coccineum TaxID=301880 RepID=A0ABQ4WG97_9ASTR